MTSETSSDPTLRVTTSEQSPVLRQLEVEVDARRVRRAFDRAYRELAKQARVRRKLNKRLGLKDW